MSINRRYYLRYKDGGYFRLDRTKNKSEFRIEEYVPHMCIRCDKEFKEDELEFMEFEWCPTGYYCESCGHEAAMED